MITYDKDEKIVHIARRHKIAFTLETIFLLIAAILPYIAYKKGLTIPFIDLFAPPGENTIFLSLTFYILWLLFLWILFFIAWSDYYLDVWIITDGRVIDVEQTGIFRRRINAFRLDKITDMIITKNAFLAKFFNYGDIHVQLQGQSRKFIIAEVTEPEKIKEMISNEQKKTLERLKDTVQFEEGK